MSLYQASVNLNEALIDLKKVILNTLEEEFHLWTMMYLWSEDLSNYLGMDWGREL